MKLGIKGWEKLAAPVLEFMEHHGVKPMQIKEKFGGLRIYYGASDSMSDLDVDILELAVDRICELSHYICIECGKSARMHHDGWSLPLCEDHSKECKRDWERAIEPRWISNMYKVDE